MQKKTAWSRSPESTHSYFKIYFPSLVFLLFWLPPLCWGKRQHSPKQGHKSPLWENSAPQPESQRVNWMQSSSRTRQLSTGLRAESPRKVRFSSLPSMSILSLHNYRADYSRNKRTTPRNKLPCNSPHHYWWTNQVI